MAKQKVSERTVTITKTGGYVHIILPSIIPGKFDSFKIPVTALLSGYGNLPIELAAQTGNITQSIAVNTWIDKITLFQSGGTPTVRIGTTPNGQEVMMDVVISDYITIKPEIYTKLGMTLYFTINGGSVNIRIDTNSTYDGNI